jgi:hypothetical protein
MEFQTKSGHNLGIRWKGKNDKDKGFPLSYDNPVWFILVIRLAKMLVFFSWKYGLFGLKTNENKNFETQSIQTKIHIGFMICLEDKNSKQKNISTNIKYLRKTANTD